jgi:hypothetical protein
MRARSLCYCHGFGAARSLNHDEPDAVVEAIGLWEIATRFRAELAAVLTPRSSFERSINFGQHSICGHWWRSSQVEVPHPCQGSR